MNITVQQARHFAGLLIGIACLASSTEMVAKPLTMVVLMSIGLLFIMRGAW